MSRRQASPARRVLRYLVQSGLSERAFARAMGIDHSALNRILRGERDMGELIRLKIELGTKALARRTRVPAISFNTAEAA